MSKIDYVVLAAVGFLIVLVFQARSTIISMENSLEEKNIMLVEIHTSTTSTEMLPLGKVLEGMMARIESNDRTIFQACSTSTK